MARHSRAPSGAHPLFRVFRWFRSFLTPPPANFHPPSGRHLLGLDNMGLVFKYKGRPERPTLNEGEPCKGIAG